MTAKTEDFDEDTDDGEEVQLKERKKEKVLAKLQFLNDQRKQKMDSNRTKRDEISDPTENVDVFAREFKKMVEEIESDLVLKGGAEGTEGKEKSLTKIASSRENVAKGESDVTKGKGCVEAEGTEGKEESLTKIALLREKGAQSEIDVIQGKGCVEAEGTEGKEKSLTKIALLREKVAKSAYFLPSFDAEKSMKTCDLLEKKARGREVFNDFNAEDAVDERVGKTKKFSFAKSKTMKKAFAEKTTTDFSGKGADDKTSPSSAAVIEMLQKKHRATNGLLVVRENKEGETILLTSEECDGKDVTIERLTRCEVTIESCANRRPRSVRMRNLVECEIKATDIDGSAYVENMSDTIAFIGSRQLRIHDATKCQFYCRVASGPIIERCQAVEFAPLLSSENDGKEDDNLWNKVEDFGWIKQEHSPNWSVIEEKDRVY
tara:strand:+ start:234 stop:1532 length:1299 start_codon:yes stop_codon:yes gene_type:complete